MPKAKKKDKQKADSVRSAIGNEELLEQLALQIEKVLGNEGQTLTVGYIRGRVPENLRMESTIAFGDFLSKNHVALGLDRFPAKKGNFIYRLLSATVSDEERLLMNRAAQIVASNKPITAEALLESDPRRKKCLAQKFQGDHTFFLTAHPELKSGEADDAAKELDFARLVQWMPGALPLKKALQAIFGGYVSEDLVNQFAALLEGWKGASNFSIVSKEISLKNSFKLTYQSLATQKEHLDLRPLRANWKKEGLQQLVAQPVVQPVAPPVAPPTALPVPQPVAKTAPQPAAAAKLKTPQLISTEVATTSQSVSSGSQRLLKIRGRDIELVQTPARATDVAQALLASVPKFIAVDCEGISLGSNGKLCLVQLTAKGFPIYLFSTVEHEEILGALKPLFENEKVVKVLHDCRQDCAALEAFGIRLAPMNDTQKMWDALQELTSRLDGGGQASWVSQVTTEKKIGLNQLLKTFGFPENPYKQKMKNQHDKWDQPLSSLSNEMIEYAGWDVLDLLELRDSIQDKIDSEIQRTVLMASEEYARSSSGSPVAAIPGANLASGIQRWLPPPVGKDGTSSGPQFEVRFDGKDDIPFRFESAQDQTDHADEASPAPLDPISAEVISILSLLPEEYKKYVVEALRENSTDPLVEFVADLGRVPTLKLKSGKKVRFDNIAPPADLKPFLELLLKFKLTESRKQLDVDEASHVEDLLNKFFSSDNRVGIRGSLHRISCKRNRTGAIDGLTYRIGRHAPGCAQIVQDVVSSLAAPADDISAERKSLLLMGKPGTGKTTLLREVAHRLASDELDQSVMIVDSSNEIGGDSEIPHEAVGYSRRMEVPDRAKQHQQMIEAVQNHSPDIIIIDEIGTSPEVQAAQTIAHRGVSLIATAHGGSLAAAVRNNVLKPLLGGIETVILSAQEAAKDTTGQKGKHRTVRKEPPTFSTLIEILKPGYVRIYHNLAEAVDRYLEGRAILVEERWIHSGAKDKDGGIRIFGKFAFVTPGALKGDIDVVKSLGDAVSSALATDR